MMHAHNTAGLTAAVARASVQQGHGYGWQIVALPCDNSAFAMNLTGNKRPPRRLGQRST